MILVLAEKPEEARDIASSILTGKKTGSSRITGTFDGEECTVISAFGHLLRLAEPHEIQPELKTWKLEDLPIFFREWKILPIDEEYKKKRLAEIHELLKSADTVIAAGDPDEEGQLLIDEILEYFKYKGPVKRVFVNDNMPENIRREFHSLKENKDYESMGRSAKARQIADMCFGVNETRLAAIRTGARNISVGRVQTPSLGLVVTRDELIEGHVTTKYYDLTAVTDHNPASSTGLPFKWSPDKRYLEDLGSSVPSDKDYVQRLADAVKGSSVKITTTEKVKTSNPPLPYNLTVLQSDMNKRYGFSANKTLDITQSLRSKKAITYNRTDSQYLKEEHFEDAPDLFATILGGKLIEKYHLDFTRHSSAFNDKNVTAHHGMIPQKNNIDVSTLTEPERKVYMAIAERYAMQFMPPEIKDVSTSTFTFPFEGHTHTFTYTASRTKDPGYTAYFGKEKDTDEEGSEESGKIYIPAGTWTAVIEKTDIKEKETKPPARYTQGTLIKDMASIAKYVTDERAKEILKKKDDGKRGENGGIGTTATRASIIEILIKRGFIEEKGKYLISTDYGRKFYHMLPKSITKADTTAWWWLIQESIKDGKEKDINAVAKAVLVEFAKHKDTAYKSAGALGGEAKEKVSGIWNGKEVQISREWGTYRFSDEELAKLFNGEAIEIRYQAKNGRVSTIKGMLAEQKYKKKTYVGFKMMEPEEGTVREGYVAGIWNGKKVQIKQVWGTHTFTDPELECLFLGETITFDYEGANGMSKITGRLEERTYKGKKYVGFQMVDREAGEAPEGYVNGTWNGKKVCIKKSWGKHFFTEGELDALFAGEKITFNYPTESGGYISFTGMLKEQTYKGKKYVGFAKDENAAPAEREGYVTGTWNGKQVQIKRTWASHEFTDEELEELFAGNQISFEYTSKAGEQRTAFGSLANQTYKGRKFVGFNLDD